jgi:hypothetical protein
MKFSVLEAPDVLWKAINYKQRNLVFYVSYIKTRNGIKPYHIHRFFAWYEKFYFGQLACFRRFSVSEKKFCEGSSLGPLPDTTQH